MIDDLLERMGQLIDSCDNHIAAGDMPLPLHIHVEGLLAGMREIRDELFAIYTEAGGEDVWSLPGEEL